MMQFLFFGISITVLFAGHGAFWYFFVRFFHITSNYGKVMVAIILFGLFFNSIVSSYIINRWENIFTRIYYTFSALWIGLAFNLCLMAAIIAIIKIASSFSPWPASDLFLKIIFLAGAIIWSLFGVYRAFYPKISDYEVFIKNLPAEWEGKTIVQLSDLHLGPIYRQAFFDRISKTVSDMRPAAIFITGDLFDGTEAEFSWLDQSLASLKAPLGTYYGFGNHDLYLGFNRVIDQLKDSQIKILDNSLVEVSGLQIIGINYSFNSDFNLEEAILKQVGYESEKPSILLLHAPKNIPLAKKSGIDLQLSGHTHDGQLWPFNYLVSWAHHGYGYGFFQEGDFSLVVNSGVGSWGPPMRTTARSEIVRIILRKKI